MKKQSKFCKARRWLFWDSMSWGQYIFGMKPPEVSSQKVVKPPFSFNKHTVKPLNKSSWYTRLLTFIQQLYHDWKGTFEKSTAQHFA